MQLERIRLDLLFRIVQGIGIFDIFWVTIDAYGQLRQSIINTLKESTYKEEIQDKGWAAGMKTIRNPAELLQGPSVQRRFKSNEEARGRQLQLLFYLLNIFP
jgi:hypothetical protein